MWTRPLVRSLGHRADMEIAATGMQKKAFVISTFKSETYCAGYILTIDHIDCYLYML